MLKGNVLQFEHSHVQEMCRVPQKNIVPCLCGGCGGAVPFIIPLSTQLHRICVN